VPTRDFLLAQRETEHGHRGETERTTTWTLKVEGDTEEAEVTLVKVKVSKDAFSDSIHSQSETHYCLTVEQLVSLVQTNATCATIK